MKNDLCQICGQQSICNGLGVFSYDVHVDHPDFGKLFRCPNNPVENDLAHQQRLRSISNLGAFQDKNFENFQAERPMLTKDEQNSLLVAYNMARDFAVFPDGWLMLTGSYGCGKTHLAAAIGNERLAHGDMVLFITTPDLLDHLRSTYGPSSEMGYDEMFDRIRDAKLLILDDLGSENPSQWAGEKLFQLLNHRYSQRLPTVITTNIDLERLDGRIRSRLLDVALIKSIEITAPDYRSTTNSKQLDQLTNLSHYKNMTFEKFDVRTGVNDREQKNLQDVKMAARQYADDPKGWLVITGHYGCGKTHVAAAIANTQRERGTGVIFTTVPDLMDYLRMAFNTNAPSSLQHRFQSVLDTPLLILDDLNADQSTAWVREKLFQLIEYRYTGQMPTIITTAKQIEELDERIASRFLDRRLCKIIAISAPSLAERLNPNYKR